MDKVLKLQAGNSAVTSFDDVSHKTTGSTRRWRVRSTPVSPKATATAPSDRMPTITREELTCVLVNALGQQNEADGGHERQDQLHG